jgi:predicted lipoprotein
MNSTLAPTPKAAPSSRRRAAMWIAAGVAILVAIALDTTVVQIGSEADVRQATFSPDEFGKTEFPRIQAFVEGKAVDAATLGQALLADKNAAAKQYGTASSTGAIVPVKLSGVVGEGKSGIYDLKVGGVPADIRIRVQTGPAINGTDLRDVTGDIAFGSFKNQIEFQDAGSGINRAMKAAVLDGIDAASLPGKTMEVTGAFRLINPKNWLITPVKVVVK